jgi:hypothetical protein
MLRVSSLLYDIYQVLMDLKVDELPWLRYLLPQGFSDALNCRITQQVDLGWGDTVDHLKTIVDNKVASKLFDKKSILCVGPDMVPHSKGKKVGLVSLSCLISSLIYMYSSLVRMRKLKKPAMRYHASFFRWVLKALKLSPSSNMLLFQSPITTSWLSKKNVIIRQG